MGRRGRALSILLLAGIPVLQAQVPAQANVLALRGLRATPTGVAVAFDVRDGRGASVPGVAARDVQVQAGGRPATMAGLDARVPAASVWVLDATRRARLVQYAALQQAYASWADSLRGRPVAVVAAGRPPRLVQAWTTDARAARAAVDNVSPRADDADLGASLRLGAETCASLPPSAPRCAVLLVSDARDTDLGGAHFDSTAAALQALGVPVYAALVGTAAAASDALARLVQASGGLVVTAPEAGAAVQVLRARVGEGYVARMTGLPTGRPVTVRVAVRTADGRTLADSATVVLAAPATAEPPADTSARHVERRKEGRWKLWAGLASLLVAAGAAWLFFGRRKPDDAAAAAQSERPPASAGSPGPLRPEPAPGPGAASVPAAAPSMQEASGAPWLILRPLKPGAATLKVTGDATRTLGRAAPPADVAVPGDGAISARHAALERHGDRILLRDLGSTNGTTVNGVPVEGSVVLADGDVIRLGETDLRVSLPSPGAAS